MNHKKLSRQELYELVWSTPFTKLAKIYTISDAGIRKICVKMGIPIPDFGHWAKVQHKKDLIIKELPEKHDGDNEVTLLLREEGDTVNKRLSSTNYHLKQEKTDKKGDDFIVSEKLTNPSRLILEVQEYFNKRKHDNYKGLIRSDFEQLNIEVGRSNIGRALRFMDTFVKIMENRGHSITNDWKLTYLVIRGEKIRIRLSEKVQRISKSSKYSWPEYDYLPTGILIFTCVAFNYNRIWTDGKLAIEKQLAKIIAVLECKGEELEKQRIEWEKIWAINREKQRIEDERIKLQEKELNDVKALLKNYRRWKEAENIRKYLDQTESLAKLNQSLTPEKQTWIQWAKEKANWLDPLIASEDEFLDEDDKDELFVDL